MYDSYVLFECCKSRSGVAICCNVYTHMLQVYVLNVLAVFKRMLQVVYLDVHMLHWLYTYATKRMFSNVSAVSNVCCKCLIWMLHMLQWSYTYDAIVCFQMFQLLQMYVASVLSKCRCICCSGHTHMLQVYILNVLFVFRYFLQQMLHVASVP
jgi:hypothetical protein